MDVERVDPRTANWETQPAAYRVYFWRRGNAPPDVPVEHVGFASTAYELRGVEDVAAAIAWADENRQPDQEYTLYAAIERGDIGTWLVQLLGNDPTRSSTPEAPVG